MKNYEKMWEHEQPEKMELFIKAIDVIFFLLWFLILPIFLIILTICILLNM